MIFKARRWLKLKPQKKVTPIPGMAKAKKPR